MFRENDSGDGLKRWSKEKGSGEDSGERLRR